MSICKVARRKNGFGIVTEDVMLNTALSSDARFLIAMVSVLAPDWTFYFSWLKKKTGWGRDKLQKVMKDLERAGHLSRKMVPPRKGKGKMSGSFTWEYHFYLEPDFQEIENQAPENQAPENHANKPVTFNQTNAGPEKASLSGSARAVKKDRRESTTSTKEQPVDGGLSVTPSAKEKREDTPLTESLKGWLADNVAEDLEVDSPMIARTARALASRVKSMSEFNALYPIEIQMVYSGKWGLKDVRQLFALDKH